jgi:hypothetical protein
MKTFKIFKYVAFLAVISFILITCKEKELGPVMKESSTFVAPSITNPATTDPVEFLAENAATIYEEFKWNKAEYGIQLSTNYLLQMDTSANFVNPLKLFEGSGTSSSVTVETFNNAMLTLGLPGFEQSTVYLRVRATINGYPGDTLYSGSISRTATTYQSSECGNYCTVGIIGDASPGGWGVDTDMHLADPTKTDKYTWTVTLYLSAGSVKFRASDAWDVNWGAADFPTGTGVQNGANIPIAVAGYYKVTFSDATGDYTFTALSAPTFTDVGIIGSATANGWDDETVFTQDGTNPHIWTFTVTLATGEAKFRANHDWANNWGETTYPSGFGVGNGPNIPIAVAGTYFVRFNDVSGEYSFMAIGNSASYPAIGVIGPAQEGGWDNDTDMIQNPDNPYLWSKILTLSEADAKFRANNAWDVNWGSGTFPGGVGVQNGSNIPIKAGTYFITFNTGTGEYYFLK